MATEAREAPPAYGDCCEDCISLVRLGVALAVLGLTAWANLLLTALAMVNAVGVWMLAAGCLEFVYGLWGRHGRWRVFWSLHSLCYLAAGYWFARDPHFTNGRSWAYAAISLGFSGFICALTAVAENRAGWRWMVAPGLFSIIAAAILAASGAFGAFWLAGMILSIDLIYRGSMQILTGFTLRWDALTEQEQGKPCEP